MKQITQPFFREHSRNASLLRTLRTYDDVDNRLEHKETDIDEREIEEMKRTYDCHVSTMN